MRRYFDEWQLSLETVQMQVIEQILRTGRGQAQLGKDFWLELRAGVLCIREDADVLELEPLEVGPGDLPENPLAQGSLRLVNCEQFTNLQKHECNILKKTIDYDKIYGRLFLRQKKRRRLFAPCAPQGGKAVAQMVERTEDSAAAARRIPILSDERSPVWVYGLGVDKRVLPTEETTRFW